MTAPTGDTTRAAIVAALADWNRLPSFAYLPPVQRAAVADALIPTVQQLIAQAVTTALNDARTELGKARDDCPNIERRRAYGYALHVLRARAAEAAR